MVDDATAVAATTGVAQVFDLHAHPREEEAIFVLQGTANMSIAGEEVTVPAGTIVKFPAAVPHDVRNLGHDRLVIMFLKVNPKVFKE